jgi:hypothetical protein
MQNGDFPAMIASAKGCTATLALLLSNNADVNATIEVRKFYKYCMVKIDWL